MAADPDLTPAQVELCLAAADRDWSEIDPSILGTLFVRGLDPEKREELGAEYTSREKILTIIEPVLTQPILRDWKAEREIIEALLGPARQALEAEIAAAAAFPELAEEVQAVQARLVTTAQLSLFESLPKLRKRRVLDNVRSALRAADRAYRSAMEQGERRFRTFLERLRGFRVLDPACGSGNFLYLALNELKTLEWRIALEGEALGFERSFASIGPEAVLGIELNPYPTLPDKNLIVIARDDDLMFGLLHSRFHEVWSLRKGSDLQDRPRYTHTSTFATFPFPEGLTPDLPLEAALEHPASDEIAAAAADLNTLRGNWLWPSSLYRLEPETTPGFPDRRVAVDAAAADQLRSRTLTTLYNDPPEWLRLAQGSGGSRCDHRQRRSRAP